MKKKKIKSQELKEAVDNHLIDRIMEKVLRKHIKGYIIGYIVTSSTA